MASKSEPRHKWPDTIYYVCNSTFGNVVNAIPIAHAGGADHIVGMRILCEAADPQRPNAVEKRQSIDPAVRLRNFACRHDIHQIETVTYGNSHSYTGWSEILERAAEHAACEGATLVYNVTGGKKNMVLGLLLGTPKEILSSSFIVSVSPVDGSCSRLLFDNEGMLIDQHTLTRRGRICLNDLIALHGYEEIRKCEREQHEEFITAQRKISEKVLETVTSLGRGGALALGGLQRAMNFEAPGIERKTPAADFFVKVEEIDARSRNRRALEAVMEAFEGLPDLQIRRGGGGKSSPVEGIEVKGELARRFIAGIWLESAVFGLVCDIFRDNPEVEVAPGVELAVEGARSRFSNDPPAEMEIDVAIAIKDQLHVVEVKAVTGSRGFGEYSPKLVKAKEELGSQRMNAFLVAPLLDGKEIEREDWAKRARKQGIRLIFGRNALNSLRGALKMLKRPGA